MMLTTHPFLSIRFVFRAQHCSAQLAPGSASAIDQHYRCTSVRASAYDERPVLRLRHKGAAYCSAEIYTSKKLLGLLHPFQGPGEYKSTYDMLFLCCGNWCILYDRKEAVNLYCCGELYNTLGHD